MSTAESAIAPAPAWPALRSALRIAAQAAPVRIASMPRTTPVSFPEISSATDWSA